MKMAALRIKNKTLLLSLLIGTSLLYSAPVDATQKLLDKKVKEQLEGPFNSQHRVETSYNKTVTQSKNQNSNTVAQTTEVLYNELAKSWLSAFSSLGNAGNRKVRVDTEGTVKTYLKVNHMARFGAILVFTHEIKGEEFQVAVRADRMVLIETY